MCMCLCLVHVGVDTCLHKCGCTFTCVCRRPSLVSCVSLITLHDIRCRISYCIQNLLFLLVRIASLLWGVPSQSLVQAATAM